ncbi:MAG: hypothetical protein HQL14_05745 [Candidatus Omnitrophica bacterium]|nr:hypothetical protein [Candidatus Omnitrophota bacterium]
MQQPDISNLIRTDKEAYGLGEPINIFGELTNNSKQALRINKVFVVEGSLHPFFFSLDEKKELSWRLPPMPLPLSQASFLELSPGETVSYSIPGLDRYLSDGPPSAGSYRIRIDYISSNYDWQSQKKLDAWAGIANSQDLHIVIE